MKALFSVASLLIITSFPTQKVLRIINDSGREYIVQIRRYTQDGNSEYFCRPIYGIWLNDLSYETHKNKLETVWHEHATQLKKNVAYQLTLKPKHLLSILIFAKAHEVAGRSYSYDSLPSSVSLAKLLGEESKENSETPPRVQTLHIVKGYEYSPRVDQKKLKANL